MLYNLVPLSRLARVLCFTESLNIPIGFSDDLRLESRNGAEVDEYDVGIEIMTK